MEGVNSGLVLLLRINLAILNADNKLTACNYDAIATRWQHLQERDLPSDSPAFRVSPSSARQDSQDNTHADEYHGQRLPRQDLRV